MACHIKNKWIKIELEHTRSKTMAKKIVNDHLKEWGCGYYPSLINMEKGLAKNKILMKRR